jgi:GH25 family lysozyme M1 (1,4-beta-N-acetylmuramidase)
MPVLLEDADSPHEYFFYSHWGTLEAVRWKDWKLRIIEGEEALYNLKTDIAEQTNLKDQHPDIVERLKIAMQEFDREVTNTARPVGHVTNPKALTLINSGINEN